MKSDGLSAVCTGASHSYCIDPIPGCTSYAWTLSGGGSIFGSPTGTCVTVNWGAATGGPYELTVTPNCAGACVAPGVAEVSVGNIGGPMSCLHEINVSLNNDCRSQLRPDMFLTSPIAPGVEYQLMLTDHQGNAIPNGCLLYTSPSPRD